ncbi:hypothetical protein KC19_10G014800 [Ceratodon purpureus]|uniref:Transmembrane protein n=1 Tax=Ceratodon purpureus TaxID=3225 RepID=A0A8T0GKL8_CERPU|nr:hypothetical protein KC19_10G014800 [Ceratodon purpureus]
MLSSLSTAIHPPQIPLREFSERIEQLWFKHLLFMQVQVCVFVICLLLAFLNPLGYFCLCFGFWVKLNALWAILLRCLGVRFVEDRFGFMGSLVQWELGFGFVWASGGFRLKF